MVNRVEEFQNFNVVLFAFRLEEIVNAVDLCLGVESARDAGLIGYHNQLESFGNR